MIDNSSQHCWTFGLKFLFLVTVVLGLLPNQAAAGSPRVTDPSNSVPLAHVLNSDGTLAIPAAFQGSIDPTGYQLVNDGGPPRFASLEGLDNANWDPRFSLSGMNRDVTALLWDGTYLYAGGYFTSAGYCSSAHGCNRIARWDGTEWSPLGAGMDNPVTALAWDGMNLYAGGLFTSAGDCSSSDGCSGIARWDGAKWLPLGTGTSGSVYSLAWDGASLYAGGVFTGIGNCSSADGCRHVARWNGAQWLPLGMGMNNTVRALVWDGTNLYAGGRFTSAGHCSSANGCNRLARWDGVEWSPLGTGMNNVVYALAGDATTLYAGGSFTSAGNCSSSDGCNRIAQWDGANWSPLGTGMVPNVNYGDEPAGSLPESTMMGYNVYALAWDGSNLYAGGWFANAGDCSSVDGCNYIARWDGASWSPLATGMDFFVFSLTWDGTNLIAGGAFDSAGDCSIADGCIRIARWDSTATGWSGLYQAGEGVNYPVNALVWDGLYLYAGGKFFGAGGCSYSDGCNSVARWDGVRWSSLGSGMDGSVDALVWDGTHLYAGGSFTNAGNCSSVDGCNRIARWDGVEWSSLGTGMNSSVWALAWDGTNLYAGGFFTSAGDCTSTDGCAYIARWDGNAWRPLHSGMSFYVNALIWTGTDLYAGGAFTSAGDCYSIDGCNRIARWNGVEWSALETGMDSGSVSAMAWDGSNLYAGGFFAGAGSCSSSDGCSRVARWNGAEWSPLGMNTSISRVSSLAWVGTNLYAGGTFSNLGNCSSSEGCNHIARWDGSEWSPLGTGMDDDVRALAWDGNSLYPSLYAGGRFSSAGTSSANHIARWRLAAVWDGGGPDNAASTAANWSGDTIPDPEVVAIFDSTSAKDVVIDADFPDTVKGWVIEERYGGTISLARPLTVTVDFQQHGGRFQANSEPLTIGAQFWRSGGVFDAGASTLIFDSPWQSLTLNRATTFFNLFVGNGTTLIERVPGNQATVVGALINEGVIRQSQTVTGMGLLEFGLTGIAMEITDQGTLSAIVVDRIDNDHPEAAGDAVNIATGRYWVISPSGSDYAVVLALPHNDLEDPKACRWLAGAGSGAGWDCDRDEFNAEMVARRGITEFSEWSVGNRVGPTAVSLHSLSSQNQVVTPFAVVWGVMLLLIIAGLWIYRRG
jgi:trimeric autotransporter adhesin